MIRFILFIFFCKVIKNPPLSFIARDPLMELMIFVWLWQRLRILNYSMKSKKIMLRCGDHQVKKDRHKVIYLYIRLTLNLAWKDIRIHLPLLTLLKSKSFLSITGDGRILSIGPFSLKTAFPSPLPLMFDVDVVNLRLIFPLDRCDGLS